MGPVGILAMAWLSAMERCIKLQQEGMEMPAFRYDDLIGHPEESVERIGAYCEMPVELHNDMLAAFGGDSQKNSVISRDRQRDIELSQRDKDTIRMVLSKSDIVDSVDFRIETNARH